MEGICALCSKATILKDSHFMPKSVYRVIANSFPDEGKDLVFISGSTKSAAYTSKQAKKHLLCEKCESLFSKHGEDAVLPLIYRPNGFKLATKIRKFKTLATVKDEKWCFPLNDIFAKSFMYFAVSIAWRSSCTEWEAFGMPKTKGNIRTETMRSFKNYLLGMTSTPSNTFLAVYVHNQNVKFPSMGFPTIKNHEGYQHIVFELPGVKFSLISGHDISTNIYDTYSVNNSKVYFISRDLSSHPDFNYVVNFMKHESIPRGRLAKELGGKNV